MLMNALQATGSTLGQFSIGLAQAIVPTGQYPQQINTDFTQLSGTVTDCFGADLRFIARDSLSLFKQPLRLSTALHASGLPTDRRPLFAVTVHESQTLSLLDIGQETYLTAEQTADLQDRVVASCLPATNMATYHRPLFGFDVYRLGETHLMTAGVKFYDEAIRQSHHDRLVASFDKFLGAMGADLVTLQLTAEEATLYQTLRPTQLTPHRVAVLSP